MKARLLFAALAAFAAACACSPNGTTALDQCIKQRDKHRKISINVYRHCLKHRKINSGRKCVKRLIKRKDSDLCNRINKYSAEICIDKLSAEIKFIIQEHDSDINRGR